VNELPENVNEESDGGLPSVAGSPSSIPGAAWHDEYLKAADRAIRMEMERNNALEIIRRLVTAKNEKDAHGVTARYRGMKEGLWEAARKILPENREL